jgi:hypothetical protein
MTHAGIGGTACACVQDQYMKADAGQLVGTSRSDDPGTDHDHIGIHGVDRAAVSLQNHVSFSR